MLRCAGAPRPGSGSGSAQRARARRRVALIVFALVAALIFPAAPVLAAGTAAGPIAPAKVRGYPVVLASGSLGEVWFGGATNDAGCSGTDMCPSEFVERVDEIDPSGAISDFEFPPSLAEYFPRYFAAGSGGVEWFLANRTTEPTPLLGEVTALGTFAVTSLQVSPGTLVRGLAMGPEGDLWSTATRRRGRAVHGALLRISPSGAVTHFARGLLADADPANITVGPEGELWFTDTVGRIGRISPTGAIHEVPLGSTITTARPVFEPSRPIVVSGSAVWVIAGANRIARMSSDGHVSFFIPPSSYHGAATSPESGELVGLAVAPDGDVWFTRESGEVGRIDASGRVHTVTNRLVNAYGIAFGPSGVAWVGEGPGFRLGLDTYEGQLPPRVARIEPDGAVTQYPPLAPCHVPRLIGLERVFAEGALYDYKIPACNRLTISHVAIRRARRRGRLIVVSQTPRAGTPFAGYRDIRVTLEAAPPFPRSCRSPAYYSLIAHSAQLIAWKVTRGSGEHAGEEVTETYYACAPPNGRKLVLAEGFSAQTCGGSVRELRFAGSYAALVESSGCQYGNTTKVHVLDVRNARATDVTVAEAEEGELSEGPGDLRGLGGPVGVGAESLVLDDRGDVAWIGESPERKGGPPAQMVLYVRDRSGTRRLASASAITALAFSGEQLVWREGDVARATSR
jgi:streptogramin lyase